MLRRRLPSLPLPVQVTQLCKLQIAYCKMRQTISSVAFYVGRSLARISYSTLLTVQSNSRVHHVFQVDPRAEGPSFLGEVANNNRKSAIPTPLHMMYVLLAKSGPVTLHCIELKGLASWRETIQFLSLFSRF